MSELVDAQVENDDRLEAEQGLGLAPALAHMGSGVEVKPANHEQGHHAALQNDPTLLDAVADRVVVRIFVEIVRSDVVRVQL